MRRYYYLSQLESSPFDVSIEDALHLGATGKLKVYVFVERVVQITDVMNGKAFTSGDFFLQVQASHLAEIEKQYVSWSSQAACVREKTSGLNTSFEITAGIIDDKFDGGEPFKSLPIEGMNRPCMVTVQDVQNNPVTRYSSEMLCWSDDLRQVSAHSNGNAEDLDHNRTYVRNLERAVVALTHALKEDKPKFKYGENPNLSQISRFAVKHLADKDERYPQGWTDSNIKKTLESALKNCPLPE